MGIMLNLASGVTYTNMSILIGGDPTLGFNPYAVNAISIPSFTVSAPLAPPPPPPSPPPPSIIPFYVYPYYVHLVTGTTFINAYIRPISFSNGTLNVNHIDIGAYFETNATISGIISPYTGTKTGLPWKGVYDTVDLVFGSSNNLTQITCRGRSTPEVYVHSTSTSQIL
jgi:hypothetical protein